MMKRENAKHDIAPMVSRAMLPESFFEVIRSALDGDTVSVSRCTEALARECERRGERSTAERLYRAARGDFGAQIRLRQFDPPSV